MLATLSMKDVGPADEMSIAFRERMNFITGDNGLGKSFLLDMAWWALTETWARGPIRPGPPPARPTIALRRQVSGDGAVSHTSTYDRVREMWSGDSSGRARHQTGLTLYVRVDGGISVSEPMRAGRDRSREGLPTAMNFTMDGVWHGNDACEGLIRDWASWQREGTDAFRQLTRVLHALSPSPNQPLHPGELRRLTLADPKAYPTLSMPYGDEVPVIHASAGMRRVMALGYMLVWTWREHVEACRLVGRQPTRELTLLIDEVEAHLHPQWQRRIVPALLDVMRALTGDEGISLQLIAVTHSPLVLASLEPHFEPERDAIFMLDLVDKTVTLEEFEWTRLGDADAWLTSDIFDLHEARSIEAETALRRARALVKADEAEADQIREVDGLLQAALSATDRFWLRWSAWRDAQLGTESGA